MPSTRPVSGASSTEPFTSTISAWRPVLGEVLGGHARVLGGDADPAEAAQRVAPIGSPPSRAATTMRQRP